MVGEEKQKKIVNKRYQIDADRNLLVVKLIIIRSSRSSSSHIIINRRIQGLSRPLSPCALLFIEFNDIIA